MGAGAVCHQGLLLPPRGLPQKLKLPGETGASGSTSSLTSSVRRERTAESLAPKLT